MATKEYSNGEITINLAARKMYAFRRMCPKLAKGIQPKSKTMGNTRACDLERAN